MQLREFGKTGLSVTPIGFGAAQLGYLDVPQKEATRVLSAVLDSGIGLIDTAECYPGSERLIGNAVADRRREFVLATKWGHKVDGDDPPDWSPELLRNSIERSLKLLKTEQVDIVLLHSCEVANLEDAAMIDVVLNAKRKGQTRLLGYSGDNEAAMKAIEMGVFDCLETSLSICDQQALDGWIPAAHRAGMGIMIKRPLANTCWRDMGQYSEMYKNYASVYTERLKKMNFTPESVGFAGSWLELALRFSAWQPGVSTILVGGKDEKHARENIEILDQGPLPGDVVDNLRRIWNEHDDGSWIGQT